MNPDIAQIHVRNERVELAKAWETSLTSKVSIAGPTYLAMIVLMWSLSVDKPYLNAIVPTLGFVLSTLSLPVVKSLWLGN